MKIRRISAYQVDLPLHEGAYEWSGGKSVSVFDSTVVCIETDEGVTGVGEICPLGPVYLPSYAAGARAGIAEIAPELLGEDPTQLEKLNRRMDVLLKGHPYVKSAIDMACWDVLGIASGQPVATLLGGRYGESIALYRAISRDEPDAMAARVARYRAEGYRRFQLKVGSDPDTDIQRIRADLDVYIEQPCLSYEECLSVRRRTDLPFILDESVDGIDMLLRAHADRAMDVVNIKIGKFGGLTRARQARDLCVSMGMAVTIEDAWGGDIVTAAIAHLAHSTPEQFRFTATDFNSYVTVSIADGAPSRVDGHMAASTAPGFGVQPRMDVLGEPVMVSE